jgi:uncharacterized protein (DUF4213/DUF364 family)
MHGEKILCETIEGIQHVMGADLDRVTVERAVVGLFFTDVKLDTGVAGPTVGLFPDGFLRRGVDVMGGIQVTAPDAFLDILAEGGSGYHFFSKSAEKIVLIRRHGIQLTRAA